MDNQPSSIKCPRCGTGHVSETDNRCADCGLSLSSNERPSLEVSEVLERNIREALQPHYRIEGLLGRGGMSLVYLVRELELNRLVAMKVLPLQLSLGADSAERFKREAKIAASLDHPNIVPIHRIGTEPGFIWFTMKFVRGRSLVQLARERGPMEFDECLEIIEQVASALQYAHDRGVVHRDVKPANVMVDENGWAVVCDFGIAKAYGSVPLTQTGGTLGTPSYMSPEQLYGQPIERHSDQYSLAVLTYEILAGQPPFTGESMGDILRKQCLEPPPHLADLRPDLPKRVSETLMRAMAKKPIERFPDVASFMGGLGGGRRAGPPTVRARRPSLSDESTAPMRTWPTVPWRPGRATAVALGATILALSIRVAVSGAPLPDRVPTAVAIIAGPPLSLAVGVDSTRTSDSVTVVGPAATAAPDTAARNNPAPESAPRRTSTPERNQSTTSTRPNPPPPPDDRTLIRRVVADLERAIGSAEVSRIRAVYPDLSSRSGDQWQGFFDRATNLRVDLRTQSVGVEGNSGAAVVTAIYEYERNGRPSTFVDTLEVDLRRSGRRWHVVGIRN